jgi:(1->4)-alpha-D-glucan 1-alpha-D-glucosylmutase
VADRLQPRLSDPTDELAVRFQQLTGAVMAKGVEDTAFYRCNRLIALNEVGGDPSTFGLTVEQFHAAQLDRLQQLPESMTALSTHDTKRSEDVRAWIAALAEHPQEWARFCTELFEAVPMPEPTIAYLLWQTVAAVGLIDRQRLHDYAEKAMREAAVGTGWTDPDPDFEAGVHQGIDSIYDSATLRSLVTELRQRISAGACAVVLGQKLVQLTAPGVPDVYQGTERTDDSLVDPDNRRPVDFGARRDLLAALDAAGPPAFDGTAETIDAVKLWVTSRALRARREFGERLDSYRPITTDPSSADHLIGFCRGPLITLATRLPARLSSRGGWGSSEITLPDGDWVDRLTGRTYSSTVRLESVLADYPVALLSRSGARAD